MANLFRKIESIRDGHEILTRHPYGMIEAAGGKLSFVQLRPFPKLISVAEAAWLGGWSHKRIRRDRVQVFYNQPARHRNYLIARYAVSELGTTLATMRASFRTFMEIARLKRANAVLCQVISKRVTDRIMSYWGFEPHNPKARGRHFIRRFYGNYPDYTDWVEELRAPQPPSPAITLSEIDSGEQLDPIAGD